MTRDYPMFALACSLACVAIAGCTPTPEPTEVAPPPAVTAAATTTAETPNAPGPRPDTDSESTAPRRQPPTATLPDGWVVTLEVAETPEEIQNGLMFRPSLPEDRGMLFVFDIDRVPSFWMKNTLIPLDLVFLDANGRVADFIPDVRPCKVDPCPQYIPRVAVRAVLEISAGTAQAHGVEIGQQLSIERVKGFPR